MTSQIVRGAFTYDVHDEGGEGIVKSPMLQTNRTDRLREMQTRGREGVRNYENFADVLYEWSPMEGGGDEGEEFFHSAEHSAQSRFK